MWKLWFEKLSSTIYGGAVIIGVASIVSRVVGLVRDNLLAKYFGASATLDIYNAAFKVPDFLFNIFVLGALSAAFVPIFIKRRIHDGDASAFAMANTILNLLLGALLFFGAIAFIFAPHVSGWLMADRSPEQQIATTQMMRVMLVSILFFGLSNVASGILHSFRHYLSYALAPLLYNIGIIIGITVFYQHVGMIGLAYGVVLGALLHSLMQLPWVWRLGYRYRPFVNVRDPGVRQMIRQMPGRAIALGVVQLNAMIIAAFALRLEEGSLSVWTWADNLQHVPVNVFGVSLALSSFPVFSQAFAENDLPKFRALFSENFRRILFLIVPTAITILLLRAQFVRLILGSFGGGQFDWNATVITAQVLGIFSISLFAQAMIPLLARSFFAHEDTTTTVMTSIGSMLLNIILAALLSRTLGLYGLAIAFTISSVANMLSLLMILRLKFGDLDDRKIMHSIFRIVLAALAMGLVIQGMKYSIAPLVNMRTFIGIFIQTAASISAGAVLYGLIALLAHFPEVEIIRSYWRKIRALV